MSQLYPMFSVVKFPKTVGGHSFKMMTELLRNTRLTMAAIEFYREMIIVTREVNLNHLSESSAPALTLTTL